MTASSTVTGVLLAAGPSRRFGSTVAKQLWPIEGEPLIRRMAQRALQSRLAEIVVVVGHQARQVSEAVEGLRVRLVENRKFAAGQAGSVRVGLQAVGSAASGALFIPVDQPFLGVDLIDRLVDLFEETGGPIVVPTVRGVRAAPVLFARSLFPELRRLEGDAGGRQLFPLHADQIVELPVEDPVSVEDMDTPADRERFGL